MLTTPIAVVDKFGTSTAVAKFQTKILISKLLTSVLFGRIELHVSQGLSLFQLTSADL